jgi:hypothetical protein
VTPTLRYVSDHLVSGSYLHGTRYYPSPTAFLHAASRLSRRSRAYANHLGHLVEQAYLTYRPQASNALDLALLILTADNPVRSASDRRGGWLGLGLVGCCMVTIL